MVPFIYIQDGRCLTLQLCGSPDGNFSWIVFAADCETSGFGANRLVAQSIEACAAPEAKAAAMAALLLNRRVGAVDAAIPTTRMSITHDTEPSVHVVPDVNELALGVVRRVNDLIGALELLRSRLGSPTFQAQIEHAPTGYCEPPLPDRRGSWRLLERRFMLVSPEGVAIQLTASEHRLLIALFRASGSHVTSFQARIVAFGGLDSTKKSKGSLLVLVARLRAKFRERGIDLPLFTLRGTGYYFGAECVIEAESRDIEDQQLDQSD